MFNKTRLANLCDRYIEGYWHNSTRFQLEYDYLLFGIRLATPKLAGSLQITLINLEYDYLLFGIKLATLWTGGVTSNYVD